LRLDSDSFQTLQLLITHADNLIFSANNKIGHKHEHVRLSSYFYGKYYHSVKITPHLANQKCLKQFFHWILAEFMNETNPAEIFPY
jgi:hypothetical protein